MTRCFKILSTCLCTTLLGAACTIETTNGAKDSADTDNTAAGDSAADSSAGTTSAGSGNSAGDSSNEASMGGSAGSGGSDGASNAGETSASGAAGADPIDSTEPPTQAPEGFVPPVCETEQALSDISSDLTLEAGNCYLIENGLRVSGATLTIEPGVTIKLATGASLQVMDEGALVAVGSADAPITFTGTLEEPGHWQAVAILTNNPQNRLEHVQFAYGGSATWCCDSGRESAMVLVAGTGRVSIVNSVFAYSGGNGLEVESALDEFRDNLFLGNDGAPVRIIANLAGALDQGSNYLGSEQSPNGDAFIELRDSDVSDDASWPRTNLPFRARRGISLKGAALTLSPGAQIQFDGGTGLGVDAESALTAVGDEDTPITLKGAADDVGTWLGVEVDSNTPDNRLSFVHIENAGQEAFCCDSSRRPAALLVEGDAKIAIEDSSFDRSGAYGIQAMPGSKLEPFARNHFSENAEAAMLLRASSLTQLDAATTYAGDNGKDQVVVSDDSVTQSGTWPALDVPYFIEGQPSIDTDIAIAPGAHLTFDAGAGLWVGVDGSLSAVSAAGDIRFDGRVDQAGYWLGIGFASASDLNLLEGVTIDGAGSKPWCCESARDAAAILVEPSSRVSVTNSTLSRSSGWGIFARSGALEVTESDNTFEDNALGDVSLP